MDDQLIIAQDYDDTEYVMEEYKNCGLDVNTNKTEYMCSEEKVKMVNTLKVGMVTNILRVTVTMNRSSDAAIKERYTLERKRISAVNWNSTYQTPNITPSPNKYITKYK